MNSIYHWLLALAVLFVSSCATGPTYQNTQPAKASSDAVALFNSVDMDLKSGQKAAALRKLKRIIKQYPDSELIDDSYMKLGDLYFSSGQYSVAFSNYSAIYRSKYISPLATMAKFKAAKSLIETAKFNEAMKLTNDLLDQDLKEPMLTETYELRLAALAKSGDKLESLRSLSHLSTQHSKSEKRSLFRTMAIELVETQLGDQELREVSSSAEFGFLRAYALFRLGELQKEQKNYDEATTVLINVKELLPTSELADRADLLLKQIDSLKQVEPMTIGAVLPLTGRHSKVAQKVLQGLQLGLGIYGTNPSNFRLAVVDSEGNPDVARRAVERLVTEDYAIAVVGSLLSKTSVAVASKGHELGVATIGLSQKAGITQTGNSVFRNSLTTQMQVKHLVRTSMSLGAKRFAILYPNDNYGVAFANQFWDEVLLNGGEVRAVQTYDPKETDFRTNIQRMVGTYYLEGRLDEYELRFKQWAEDKTRRSSRKHPPDDLLPPVVDFDALFIPDTATKLSQIVPMLRYNDIEQVVLLGTNIWNTPNLASRIQNDEYPLLFVDGYFADDPNLTNSIFWKEYFETFREEPTLLEIQAYETGLLLRQMVLSGAITRDGLIQQLAQAQRFPGALGPLTTNTDREFERNLVSLSLDRGEIGYMDQEEIRQALFPPLTEDPVAGP